MVLWYVEFVKTSRRKMVDIDPNDIDAETGCPYDNYSSPALDTSLHDIEMAVDDTSEALVQAGKHLAVKLAEVYRAAGHDPAKCQAIRDFMTAVAKIEDK